MTKKQAKLKALEASYTLIESWTYDDEVFVQHFSVRPDSVDGKKLRTELFAIASELEKRANASRVVK